MAEPAPLVTVLVPCWNAAATIGRALGSVLEDQPIAVECVVVDDASTDGTAEVVAALAAADPRIVLVRSPENGGASAARNLGLPHVRGEWLTFLDSDDRLLPGAIGALVSAAVLADALAVVGQRIWSNGEKTWLTKLYDQPDIREAGRKSLVTHPGLMFYASATGKLFHRSCLDGLRFDGRVLGDQPWTLRALLRAGDRIEVIADTVYEWTQPLSGISDTSITLAKRRSAARAAEAVTVAIGALRDVSDEATRVLPDPADQHQVTAAYFDRLVRADFAGPVSRALDSGDPGSAQLFAALGSFIAAAPPDVVRDSTSLTRLVIQPPIGHWERVPGSARPAVLSMVRAIPGAGADVAGRIGGPRSTRLAVRLARALPGTLGTGAAGAAFELGALARRTRARLRAARHPA